MLCFIVHADKKNENDNNLISFTLSVGRDVCAFCRSGASKNTQTNCVFPLMRSSHFSKYYIPYICFFFVCVCSFFAVLAENHEIKAQYLC